MTLGFWMTNLALAVGLSMDSFCVSASNAIENPGKGKVLRILISALVFALFHLGMIEIGYHFGALFAAQLESVFQYLTFGVLVGLGLKEIIETLHELHDAHMARLAAVSKFPGEAYIRKLHKEGLNLTEIKWELRNTGEKLKMGEYHAVQNYVDDSANAVSLGVYLVHMSHHLTKKTLAEIIHPSTAESQAKKAVWSFVGLLLLQALATSIDALAVGFTFAGSDLSEWEALAVFGMIAGVVFLFSLVGGGLGRLFREKAKTAAGIFGALVLIAIGIKALF